jgi:hypothetical protein
MSLVLEFRTPQHPEARSAGIGTNRYSPTVTRPTGATDCSGIRTAWPNRKSRGNPPDPPVTRGNRSPLGFAISLSRVQRFGIASKRVVN